MLIEKNCEWMIPEWLLRNFHRGDLQVTRCSYSRRPCWFRGLTGLMCGGAGGWLGTVGRSSVWAEGVGGGEGFFFAA